MRRFLISKSASWSKLNGPCMALAIRFWTRAQRVCVNHIREWCSTEVIIKTSFNCNITFKSITTVGFLDDACIPGGSRSKMYVLALRPLVAYQVGMHCDRQQRSLCYKMPECMLDKRYSVPIGFKHGGTTWPKLDGVSAWNDHPRNLLMNLYFSGDTDARHTQRVARKGLCLVGAVMEVLTRKEYIFDGNELHVNEEFKQIDFNARDRAPDKKTAYDLWDPDHPMRHHQTVEDGDQIQLELDSAISESALASDLEIGMGLDAERTVRHDKFNTILL
jgi:hypothetical protein